MNDESSKYRAVYAVAADGVSDSGHQLYTIHQARVPNADNWKLFVSQPAEQPRGDVLGYLYVGKPREDGWQPMDFARVPWDGAMRELLAKQGVEEIPVGRVAGAHPKPQQAVGDGVLSGKYGDVLRPFLALMDRELHANAGKGDRPGWLTMDRKTALLEIFYHLSKLQKAAKDDDQERIREYGADVANMAMMLVDVCGALDVTPRPAVATPAEVTEAIRLLTTYKTWVGGDRPDDEDDARLWDDTEAVITALTAQCQVRKDGQGVANQAEDEAFDDGEQVAQWLYRNGMRNAAFIVRGQLDVRNNRIRKLEAALASPSAGAVVPDDYREIARLIGCIFFYGEFKAETYNEKALEALLRKTGNFFESEADLLAAAPEVPRG